MHQLHQEEVLSLNYEIEVQNSRIQEQQTKI